VNIEAGVVPRNNRQVMSLYYLFSSKRNCFSTSREREAQRRETGNTAQACKTETEVYEPSGAPSRPWVMGRTKFVRRDAEGEDEEGEGVRNSMRVLW